MGALSKNFSVIFVLPLVHNSGVKTVGLVFESEEDATIFNTLLETEPYSFSFEKLESDQNQIVIRFTNSEFNHHFLIQHPIEFYVNYPDSFYIQSAFQDVLSQKIQQVGNPHLQSFYNLN